MKGIFKTIAGYVGGAGLIALSVFVPATAPIAAPVGAGMLGLSSPDKLQAWVKSVFKK